MTLRVGYHYGFPLDVGGVESHLLSLADLGRARGVESTFIGPRSSEFERRLRAVGADSLEWDGPEGRWDPVAARELADLLVEHRIGLLHVHSPRHALHVVRARQHAGRPVIQTVHLPIDDLVGGRGLGRSLRLAAHRAIQRRILRDRIPVTIFVSASVRDAAAGRRLVDRSRSVVIPNGVDLDRFRQAERRATDRGPSPDRPAVPIVVAVGRLDRQKGFDVLIRAAAILRSRGLDFRVRLVGDGPLEGELLEMVTRLEAERTVTFLGRRHDVPDLLADADLFVLPSRYEAMPIALVEALAAGLACVVTDVGDCAEIVDHGRCGTVVPAEDPVRLADAMDDLLVRHDARASMAVAARERAEDYSVDRMVKATVAIYRRVCSDGGV